jgi:acylphosphatase
MPTRRLKIHGKVQGVFYRATAKKIADRIGLTGWVKNLKTGEVEAVICGSEEQIESFIYWAREGPERAEVSHIDIKHEPEEIFSSFLVKR